MRSPPPLRWLPLLLLPGACGPAGPPPQEPAPLGEPAPTAATPAASTARPAASGAPRGEPYRFDGVALGDDYGAVMGREPYSKPCDDDPIDHARRRFMIYGAQPCRGRVFPEATSVAFYLRHAGGEDRFRQPIEAIAWLGGHYFSTRSSFPARVGQGVAEVTRALGEPVSSFTVARKGQGLVVRRHPGDAYSLAEGETVVGFVVGPMPEDPESEQWRGLVQLYVRFTRPSK